MKLPIFSTYFQNRRIQKEQKNLEIKKNFLIQFVQLLVKRKIEWIFAIENDIEKLPDETFANHLLK